MKLSNYKEQSLADFLSAEGVFKRDRLLPTYRMTSAFVDELVRRKVIANLFPSAPNPLLHDVLITSTESLKCFD